MSKIDKLLHTGKTHTTVARAPAGADHGTVNLALSSPTHAGHELDFAAVVPHPTAEQLFAGAWSACYITAIALTAAYTAVGSWILLRIVDATIGLRVAEDAEREGLDIALHGEKLA